MGTDGWVRSRLSARVHEETRRNGPAPGAAAGKGLVRYFVDWKPDALNGLSAAWVALADKAAVNDADAEIARLLARDPLAVGSHTSEGLRKLDVPPLRAYYSVDVANRVVEVLQVAFFVDPSP